MTDDNIRAAIPALSSDGVAVITGAASGIGLAASKRFAELGLNVVMADRSEAGLQAALANMPKERIRTVPCDVSQPSDLEFVRQVVSELGPIAVLMNNAAIMSNPGSCFAQPQAWRELMDINFNGVLNGVQAFGELMSKQPTPSLIINTGSKQGITTPPGNAAYNVSKAAVKVFTEALAHELRNSEGCKARAHLLIPGFTWTGMTAGGRTEKPAGAWNADQVIDFMLESIARGDFYILCPDNDVTRATDEKRMAWSMGDIIENRPALSRWHPDWAERFADYVTGRGSTF